MPEPENMQELVTQIARALVDIPEEVRVEAEESGEGTRLRLRPQRSPSVSALLGALDMPAHDCTIALTCSSIVGIN